MKILKKILAGFFIFITVVIVLILGISAGISSPSSGKSIAEKKSLKHRAVIAHRGASYLAPENTIPAYEIAAEVGADYLETDVQRTKDGILIVFHDDDFKRTTDAATVYPGREKDPVATFTYAEIMKLDAGSWFNTANPAKARKGFAGIKIPTFEQYIDIAMTGKNRPGLLIELKKPSKYPGIEKQIVEALYKKGWLDRDFNVIDDGKGLGKNRVMLQTFEYDSLVILKSIAPNIRRNFLLDDKSIKEHKTFEKLLELAKQNESEVGPWGYMAWPWFVRKVHAEDKYFFIWTIDTNLYFRMFTYFGVDGVITNKSPEFLVFLGRELTAKPEDLLKKYE